MGKVIGRTTGGRNLGVTMAIAALAAALLALTLVAVYQTAPTSSDGAANRAMSAEGKGVPSGVNHEPYIDRHRPSRRSGPTLGRRQPSLISGSRKFATC
jgi:hypothetical protein